MTDWVCVGTVEDIARDGATLVKGGIVVFAHESEFMAVENRCPHMGFPLHVGTLCEGILTCHWHHARFDVKSGGTLDPWADDVPTHEVKVEDGAVWVDPLPRERRGREGHLKRLREGLEQNISLIVAKAVVALVEAGVPDSEIVATGIEFGTRGRAGGWGSGLTILTAMANVLPKLDRYGRILALVHGLVHVARDVAGRAPHYMLEALPAGDVSMGRLASWYRQCVEVRDTQGAERVIRGGLARDMSRREFADMVLKGATDHFYLDGGHTFDFHNKALEALAYVEDAQTDAVLTSLAPLMGSPSRSEEQQNWRSPVDLVTPLLQAFEQLQSSSTLVLEAPDHAAPSSFDAASMLETILGDDPLQTVHQLTNALMSGVPAPFVAQLVALAAAERIKRFHVQNDFADWVAALHTFTHAHAVHERIRAGADPLVLRAVYHGAMRVYLDRFLNVPSAPAPLARRAPQGEALKTADLLEIMDGRQRVADAANWVARYLDEGGDVPALVQTLGHGFLREDAEFHTFQMYEAAISEYDHWAVTNHPSAEGAKRTMLYALTRYLAAHAPTARELPHIARIAWRLHRGEKLYEEE